MDATMALASRSNTRSIIVHPLFVHTLSEPPQSTAHSSCFTWRQLPHQVLQVIAAKLGAADLCSLAATCKELRALAHDEALWQLLCLKKFNVPRRSVPPESWYELYCFNHRIFKQVLSGGSGGSAADTPPLNLAAPIALQA